MYLYLSKLLPPLVLPVAIVIYLCAAALLFLYLDKRKTSGVLLLSALLLLWACSIPVVSGYLYGKLEQVYPPVAMSEIPVSKCVVLLGGSVSLARPPRVEFDMSESIDRVRKAARLQQLAKGELIIVAAANNQHGSLFALSEAQVIKMLLVEWGVPESVVVLSKASNNTRENALVSSLLIEELSCGRPLLVTSAAHMPRAVASFRMVGVDVFPVSTDVRVTTESSIRASDWIPNARSLKMTTNAMREWMGRKVYEFRGWN